MFDDRRSSLSGYDDRPTDGFAIAALVCGLIGLAPVAIGCWVRALIRINRTGERGFGLAIAGIVISVLWAGAGFATILPDFLQPARQTSSSFVAEPAPAVDASPVNVNDVGTFECFDATGADDVVTRADCHRPHDEQIFGKSDAAWALDGPYPGVPAMRDAIISDCRNKARIYLTGKTLPPGLTITAHFPTAAAWESGTRSAACTFKLESGKLTESLIY